MLDRFRHLLEMIRFSHTIFALPFALLAAVMAWSTPAAGQTGVPFRVRHLLGIVLCMVTARSAAMAFNRLADRHIDARNPRTRARHIPAGVLSVRSVVAFTLAMSLLFVAATLLFLPNTMPLILSGPVLAFLLAYSYTKRVTALAHFWLGGALLLAPVSAWVAIRGRLLWEGAGDLLPAGVLGLAVLLWVAGFDVIYACQDADFDRQTRLRSLPARLGVAGALRVAAACHAGMVMVLLVLPLAHYWGGPPLGLGWIYGCGVAAVAALLVYEHTLVRPDDLTRVNDAFFRVNAVVSLGLFALGSLDLLT